jgi:O-antigen/teichoic acid export membrane protein
MREVANGHVRGDWPYVRAVLRWCGRRVLLLSLAVIALAGAIVAAMSERLDPALQWTLYAALPMVVLASHTKVGEAALRGMNLQVIGQIPMQIVRPGVFFASLLGASALGVALNAPGAMLMHTSSMVVVAGAVALMMRGRIPPQNPSHQDQAFNGSAAFRAAIPMAMTEGLRVLNGHLSIFVVGALASAEAVGIYKVADSVGLLCGLPLSVLNVVAASQIARLHAAREAERMRRLVSYISLAMAAGSLFLAVPAVLFGHQLLGSLFGPSFFDSYGPMAVLCIGYTVAAWFGPAVVFMNMTGRERTVTQGIALSFTLNLVLGVLGVWLAGPIGAAVANVAGYLVWNVWLWHQAKRQAGVDTSLVPATRELISRIGRRA